MNFLDALLEFKDSRNPIFEIFPFLSIFIFDDAFCGIVG